MHARCKPRGGVGMPQGREGARPVCVLPARLCGGAAGALDTGRAAGGQVAGGRVLVLPPGGGKEPGGVTRGFPGGAEQSQGLCGQGDVPVLWRPAPVDMDLEALAVKV